MHKTVSVEENETHKILCDFEIQIDHLILSRRLDLVINNKKQRICLLVDDTFPADQRVKMKESEKTDN